MTVQTEGNVEGGAMLERIEARVRPEGLTVRGAFAAAPGDDLPPGARSVVLLGPDEPGFWDIFSAAPEYSDGAPDPMNRWSERVLGRIAADLGAVPLFPFGGPPWRPFLGWALRSGRAWSSPVGLLVHARAGLMVSYRGALALPQEVAVPPPAAAPCAGCADRPCTTACPVGALGPGGYDVPACKRFLDSAAGQDCRTRGCAVRRACPVSAAFPRAPAQAAFHMEAFHPAARPPDGAAGG